MTAYTGRQAVTTGLYLNLTKFSITTMDTAGPLPGTELETYRRIPMLAMLAAAPFLGLAYVIFLPLVGIGMVAYLLARGVLRVAAAATAEAVRVARPAWVPALAFFSRSKPVEPNQPANITPTEPDAWTEDVEKKLHQDDPRAK